MKLSTRNTGRLSPAARSRSPLAQPGATPPSRPLTAPQIRPGSRPLAHWPSEFTRGEGGWSGRPECPLLPRMVAAHGFLRDRLHVLTGAIPLPADMSDEAVDATLTLMLRRGRY